MEKDNFDSLTISIRGTGFYMLTLASHFNISTRREGNPINPGSQIGFRFILKRK